MNSEIITAAIGAVSAIVVALIGIWAKRRSDSKKEGRVVEPKGFSNDINIGAEASVSESVIGSTNVKIERTQYSGPVTKIEIEKLIGSIAPSEVSPHPLSDSEPPSLLFITEQEIPYNNFRAGLSLNFSLRNMHPERIVVYSMKLGLVGFWNNSSAEFCELLKHVKPPGSYMSAPIFVYGIKTHIFPTEKRCEAKWISWDDSADSRGMIFNAMEETDRQKLINFVKEVSETAMKSPAPTSGFEILPPQFRFALEPSESDSFHCQLTGHEEGIYAVKFDISYHLQNVNQSISSDRVYTFVSLNWLSRGLDETKF